MIAAFGRPAVTNSSVIGASRVWPQTINRIRGASEWFNAA